MLQVSHYDYFPFHVLGFDILPNTCCNVENSLRRAQHFYFLTIQIFILRMLNTFICTFQLYMIYPILMSMVLNYFGVNYFIGFYCVFPVAGEGSGVFFVQNEYRLLFNMIRLNKLTAFIPKSLIIKINTIFTIFTCNLHIKYSMKI